MVDVFPVLNHGLELEFLTLNLLLEQHVVQHLHILAEVCHRQHGYLFHFFQQHVACLLGERQAVQRRLKAAAVEDGANHNQFFRRTVFPHVLRAPYDADGIAENDRAVAPHLFPGRVVQASAGTKEQQELLLIRASGKEQLLPRDGKAPTAETAGAVYQAGKYPAAHIDIRQKHFFVHHVPPRFHGEDEAEPSAPSHENIIAGSFSSGNGLFRVAFLEKLVERFQHLLVAALLQVGAVGIPIALQILLARDELRHLHIHILVDNS